MTNYYNFPTKLERLIASVCHLYPVISLGLIILFNWTGIGQDWIKLLFFSRLLVPISLWDMGKNNPWIITHARNSLNFQITQTFIFFSMSIIWSAQRTVRLLVEPIGWFWFLMQLGILVTHVSLAVKASRLAQNNIDDTGKLIYPPNYPLTIPFIRPAKPSSHIIELPGQFSLSIPCNQPQSNDYKQRERFRMSIPISLVIWFICFIVSMLVGKGMAGPEIYDHHYNPEGEWRHTDEELGIEAMTISHVIFWLVLVVNNKLLTRTNIFLSILISIPYSLLFFISWFFIALVITFPNG